ncbi:MAG: thioredoxin TrxC [Burkholderiales bacterium]|nr:thioredoxin TrxC [Burkholderiales bacterium]
MSTLQIACAHCLTRNRVPSERLGDAPKCGSCKQALLPGEPVAIDAARLVRFTSGTTLPVVADFWAEWCGPCKMMAPAFAEAAKARPQVHFVKVDTEASPQAAAHYGIRGIPTLILFRDGAEQARVSGAMPASQLLAWVDRGLAT